MKKNIPFSPPFINEEVENQVLDALRSGWITTGPKVKELENAFNDKYGFEASVGVNSWTSGAILLLRWLGLKPGDEVIVPAYTYSATALAVLHAGGTPIMVDVNDDFNINVKEVQKAITAKTKAIIAVDLGGLPADYNGLWSVVESSEVSSIFQAETPVQEALGRPLLVADSAHSFGAEFKMRKADVVIFSLHAVKNLTSAEGGVISLNFPSPFNNKELYTLFRRLTLNGQSKDALDKSKAGSWRYDILELGMKCNLPDVNAAIALGQLKSWNWIDHRRHEIFNLYQEFFSKYTWAQLPTEKTNANDESSCHLYLLRIKGINEAMRDGIIERVSHTGVAVNVHFIPMPMLSLFRDLGYTIDNYPVAYDNYAREISLPIYPSLSNEDVSTICHEVAKAVEESLK